MKRERVSLIMIEEPSRWDGRYYKRKGVFHYDRVTFYGGTEDIKRERVSLILID